MNSFAFLALALVVAVSSLSEAEYRSAFESFKTNYGKTYLVAEEEHRFNVFKKNYDFINSWDGEARGFSVGINKFADLSSEEFSSLYLGTRIVKKPSKRVSPVDVSGLAADVDWRTKGAVTPVKNQGQCGSCWAFSTTGSVEGAWFLAKGNLVSLSEQNLIDCSKPEGNQGCNGGLMDDAFEYIIKNNGIDTERSYPYTASDKRCKFSKSSVGATISSYKDVSSGDENALMTAVNQQPVSVAIDASQMSFQFYSGGVYNEPSCSSSQLDHGVLVVGYGIDSGTPYWLVKNSWGSDWGMNGYIEMSRNANNQCGIATSASYPIV